MSKSVTDVIFRVFPEDRNVIALFPNEPWDGRGFYCASYMHAGQHAGASPEIVATTRLASSAEYQPLLAELHRVGYDSIRILMRFPRTSYQRRRLLVKAARASSQTQHSSKG
ncbi:MAG: hypothetical protein ACKO0Z_24880 [Betaproteobacteria bacterium]